MGCVTWKMLATGAERLLSVGVGWRGALASPRPIDLQGS